MGGIDNFENLEDQPLYFGQNTPYNQFNIF